MLFPLLSGKTHMAFVERLVTGGLGDPYREIIGLVTLEDVIEEIIQAEIVDETDIFSKALSPLITLLVWKYPRLVERALDNSTSSMPEIPVHEIVGIRPFELNRYYELIAYRLNRLILFDINP